MPEIPAKPTDVGFANLYLVGTDPISVLSELVENYRSATANYNNYGKALFDIGHAPADKSNWEEISKAMQPGSYIPR